MKLNLPSYKIKLTKRDEKQYIFDSFRNKYVVLTPEEWVRQHFAHYLVNEKKYPKGLLAIEYAITINKMINRSDIVVFSRSRNPLLVVECKAPSIKIDQKVFDQVARYNINLNVKYLAVTNGLKHYCCIIDHQNRTYKFLENIPDYNLIEMD